MVGLRVTRKPLLKVTSGNSMSNIDGAHATYLETHQAVAQKLSAAGTDWLDRHRNDALNQFGTMGLPTGRDEQWKYTNVRPIARKMFTPSYVDPRNLDSVLGEVMTLPEIESHRLVFVDGVWAPHLSRCDELPKEAFINGLADT